MKDESMNEIVRIKYGFPSILTADDFLIMFLVTIISYWTRFYRIQYPDVPIFDEVHFGRFTNGYCEGKYFFDIHPPLAKLIIYGFASSYQYDCKLNFSSSQYDNPDYISLRKIPALFSSFCPVLIYLASRCTKLSVTASFTSSIMILCENSMITEGRFLLTDGILHFFVCASILCLSCIHLYPPYTFWWYLSTLLSAFLIGCSISTKLTSLSLLPICCLYHLINILFYPTSKYPLIIDLLIRSIISIFPIIFVFLMSFVIHIILLPYNGPGDAYMGYEFRQTLINISNANEDMSKRVRSPSMLNRIIDLNIIMHQSNMRLKASHPYSSKFYQWPLLISNRLYFWRKFDLSIALLLNPTNVIITSLSVVLFVLSIFFYNKMDSSTYRRWITVSVFSTGYFCSFLPFSLIKRVLFLYHYIIPLIFGVLLYVSLVDMFLPISKRWKSCILILSQVFSAITFLKYSYLTYGI